MNTDILALDVATCTGWCRGRIGETPTCGSIRFGKPGVTDAAVFGAALDWLIVQFDRRPIPDLLIMEALLPPMAMKNETSRAVRDRLGGLHGIVKACAHRYGVGEIATATVGDVRAHFIGDRTLPRDKAKREVMRHCQMLGWKSLDDNAGDAAAVWSYACALINPEWALQVSPLFNRKLRVVVT